MTNILIVEDERMARVALCSYIASAPDCYHIVQTIENADDAELVCLREKIDLIIMDICTLCSSGIAATKLLKEKYPNIKIIIVTATVDSFFLAEARAAKADSFWHKEVSKEDFLEVMDRTMAGQSIYLDEMPEVMLGCCSSRDFSKRQLEVVYWLLKLNKTALVAEQLNISVDGVKKHIKEMKDMTGISNTGELLREITKSKLVLPEYH